MNIIPVTYNPFEHVELESVVELIEPQKELLLSCMIGGEDANLAYNESVSLVLHGKLKTDAIRGALDDLVHRHESLRATISKNGQYLCIRLGSGCPLRYIDLSSEPTVSIPSQIQAIEAEDAATAFDLYHGPLFRAILIKKSDLEFVVRLTAHHIICDGWSLGVILEDLSKLYAIRALGQQPANMPVARRFRDYVTETKSYQQTDDYRQSQAYWINRFADHAPQLELPLDYNRPNIRTYRSKRLDFPLPTSMTTTIRKVGAKHGVSLVNTLLFSFEILLHRISGQSDIAIALPCADQSISGNYELVGHCVNLLPIRSKLDNPDMTFADYLRYRRSAVMDDLEHQRFTYGSLLPHINVSRDGSRIPLVPVAFNVDMGMDSKVDFGDIQYRLQYNPRICETFEIFLNLTGSQEALTFEWSFNTALFKEETIHRLMSTYSALLTHIAAHPETPTNKIPLIQPNDLRLLDQWNETNTPYDTQLTLPGLIQEVAASNADRTAISFNSEQLTYRQLDEWANQIAHTLLDVGVPPGAKIGIAIERGIELLPFLLAIMKTGCAYIPFDVTHPKDRIAAVLEDAAAEFLLTSKQFESKFTRTAQELYIEELLVRAQEMPINTPSQSVNADSLAYILYTSGSTGKPKGAQITHRNVVNFLFGMQISPGIKATDKVLAITPLSFDMAVVQFLPLVVGAQLVLTDIDTSKDGRLLKTILMEQNITWMIATPATWNMIIDAGWNTPLPLLGISAGEALSKDLAIKLLQRCAQVWNGYGPTETTVMVLMKHVEDPESDITLGQPIQNTRIYILDEYGNRVPIGQPGEIYISGDNVGLGYLNMPEMTAAHFSQDPFCDHPTPMYRTGDLGKYLPNGDIFYLGRKDGQVKIRGHRIELGEIEHQLTQIADIKHAAVIVYRDESGNQYLVANVVRNSGTATTTEENVMASEPSEKVRIAWTTQLREKLPAYMLPWKYIELDRFPLSANGKVDQSKLQKMARDLTQGNEDYISPRSNTEKAIARIWENLFNRNAISIKSNFFDIGGHSLLAVKLVTSLEEETGRRLPLSSLFENPTIEKLSKLIEDVHQVKWNSLVPIRTSGKKPPVYLVHGGGLNVLVFQSMAKYLDKEQPVYALQAIGLNGTQVQIDSIEQVAAEYIKEIFTVDPQGPYYLAGYSLGGKIVYEMAKQLIEMGKTVNMVGVFDTVASNLNTHTSLLNKISTKVARQFRKVPFILKSFFAYPSETIAYQRTILLEKLKDLIKERTFDDSEAFTYNKDLSASYHRAYNHYEIKPIPARLDLFRVSKRLYYLDDPVYLGWDNFATGGVDIHEVPGDHKTFILPPHDQVLASVLQQCLDMRSTP